MGRITLKVRRLRQFQYISKSKHYSRGAEIYKNHKTHIPANNEFKSTYDMNFYLMYWFFSIISVLFV